MKCPLTGDPCWKHDCNWYIQVMGTDPNTGQELNNFGCAVAWLPTLLIENAQQSRQTGAAVESFRNNVVKQNDQLLGIFDAARQTKKLG